MGFVVLRSPAVAAPAAAPAGPLKLETVARGRAIQWKGAVKYNKRRPKKVRGSAAAATGLRMPPVAVPHADSRM